MDWSHLNYDFKQPYVQSVHSKFDIWPGPLSWACPADRETNGTHVLYSKATLQSNVCISKESKIDQRMQFGQFKTNFVQFIWQWATYECVCYIDMLHRDEPPLGSCLTQSLNFCLCVCGDTKPLVWGRSGTTETALPPQYSAGWQRGLISPADSSLIPISASDRAVWQSAALSSDQPLFLSLPLPLPC